jgi:hypothetical protein
LCRAEKACVKRTSQIKLDFVSAEAANENSIGLLTGLTDFWARNHHGDKNMRSIRSWNVGDLFYQRLLLIIAVSLFAGGIPLSAETPQNSNSQQSDASATTATAIPNVGRVQRTTAEIMADPRNSKPRDVIILNWEMEQPDRKNLPSRPGALELPQWPMPEEQAASQTEKGPGPLAPQTLGTQFDGATGPTETDAFPPDTMGAVGPTQFFVFLNGRMRTFNKTTGVADGVVNADSDAFFAPVITPPGAGELSFTSDPQVRYDRLTGRWFLVIIDVTLDATTGAVTRPNRVLIALTDAASNGNVTGSTVWTFYQFQGDATLFTDYESLGVDASALYIGGNMFTLAGAFNSTKGFVVPKAPLLTSSAATAWAFSGLVATSTSAGPFAPRGVDNYDPANTGATAEGYFIGVDNATFNTLMLRRVTNPGSLGPAPTISANISIATPLTTRFPVLVPHFGNTGGTSGRLDSLDDRLYAAHLRNGRLWTAHNIGVNNTGVAGAANNRCAARWYELQNIVSPGTPSVLQSGTLFDNNAVNDTNQRNYWIPSIMVSGQGHAALGCSIAGTNERVNAFTTGRLVGDTLGALRDGPGGAALPGYTASATAYNPPGDTGASRGKRRWGDYSFTSLDPKDDMTLWTIQEYCNGTDTYGVRALQLLAPLPVNPNSANPANVATGQSSVNVVLSGVSSGGSAFYDPGPNLAPPALPFNHISATVNGGGVVVNSTTYNSPTQITLNINTTGASPGPRTVTVTNPDGQFVTSTAILNIVNALQLTGAVSRKKHGSGGAGTNFDIVMPLSATLVSGTSGVEDRNGGDSDGGSSGDYKIVLTFNNPVTGGTASIAAGDHNPAGGGGNVSLVSFSGNNMVVNLAGVTNAQVLTLTASNVTDGTSTLNSVGINIGFLIGDVNSTRRADAGDVTAVRNHTVSIPSDDATARFDVTVSGRIDAGDVTATRNATVAVLP